MLVGWPKVPLPTGEYEGGGPIAPGLCVRASCVCLIPLADDLRFPTERLRERRFEGDWRGAERMLDAAGGAFWEDAN